MKNLTERTDFYELLTSLLIRGINMGVMSKLGWLIGFIKHALRAGYFQFPKS
jgi:hypothetical protein